jgi:hypothetical protein
MTSSDLESWTWLVRTNPEGTMLWNQTYDGAAESLIQCSDGGYAIIGELDGWTPLLLRTDENGELLWRKTYSSINVHGTAYSVVQCSDGGFGITAAVAESVTNSIEDAVFVRTNEVGNELWRSTCSSPDSDFADSLVLGDDGFALVGVTLRSGSSRAFLWRLTDDYVPPTGGIPVEIELMMFLGTCFLAVIAVVWNRKRRLDRLQKLGPVLHVMPRICSYP